MVSQGDNSGNSKASEDKAALVAIGVVAGAITLSALGFLLGDPPGAIIGAKIGAALGGGSGAIS